MLLAKAQMVLSDASTSQVSLNSILTHSTALPENSVLMLVGTVNAHTSTLSRCDESWISILPYRQILYKHFRAYWQKFFANMPLPIAPPSTKRTWFLWISAAWESCVFDCFLPLFFYALFPKIARLGKNLEENSSQHFCKVIRVVANLNATTNCNGILDMQFPNVQPTTATELFKGVGTLSQQAETGFQLSWTEACFESLREQRHCKVGNEFLEGMLILFATSTIIGTRCSLRGVKHGLHFYQATLYEMGHFYAQDSNSLSWRSHSRRNADCQHLGYSGRRREAERCQGKEWEVY